MFLSNISICGYINPRNDDDDEIDDDGDDTDDDQHDDEIDHYGGAEMFFHEAVCELNGRLTKELENYRLSEQLLP